MPILIHTKILKHSNFAKNTDIITTVRQVISFRLIIWKLAFLPKSPSPFCQCSYFSINLSISFLFMKFIYPLIFSRNFPEHLKGNSYSKYLSAIAYKVYETPTLAQLCLPATGTATAMNTQLGLIQKLFFSRLLVHFCSFSILE